MGMDELVLVVPEYKLQEHKLTGFSRVEPAVIESLLADTNLELMPRWQAENDPSYKQVIPYVVFAAPRDGKPVYFNYRRGSSGGESRLHAKRSLGVGGHISSEDCRDSAAGYQYLTGMYRELAEEVNFEGLFSEEKLLGLIYDDSDDVGRVHLGIVHLFKLTSPVIFAKEDCLEDGRFSSLDTLQQDIEIFEGWSRLIIGELCRSSE